MLKGCQFPGEEQRAGCLGEQRNHKVKLIKMFVWGKPVSLRQWRQIAQYEKRHSFNFFIQVTRQNDLLLTSCSRCVTFKLSWKSNLIKWWSNCPVFNCSVFILFASLVGRELHLWRSCGRRIMGRGGCCSSNACQQHRNWGDGRTKHLLRTNPFS